MEHVYLVWRDLGSYEGRELLAVFSTEKKAQVYCDEWEEHHMLPSFYVTEEKVIG